MTKLRLSHISKQFGSTQVLEDVSLSIESNEFIAFLGPSGCGKTTLLRMIAGLEVPDRGEIHIGERRVDTLPPGQRGVAMVFQHYALYPHMSIHDNMAFGLKNIGIEKGEIEKRIDEAARILEIEDHLAKKPGELSGGQKQRVAIGRAIVKNPDIFLFDEPMSNLDAALRMRTRLELAQLRRRIKATMILVTHDQVEAMTLADRIVVLKDRKVQQIGAPMEIYRRPANRFVAAFVGSPPMNFLSGTGKAEGGMVTATLAGGTVIRTKVAADGIDLSGPVTLGLRPEHIRVREDGQGAMKARVEMVERLGERTLVYLKTEDGAALTAEAVGDSAIAMGDMVGLELTEGAAHIFDANDAGYHPKASS